MNCFITVMDPDQVNNYHVSDLKRGVCSTRTIDYITDDMIDDSRTHAIAGVKASLTCMTVLTC